MKIYTSGSNLYLELTVQWLGTLSYGVFSAIFMMYSPQRARSWASGLTTGTDSFCQFSCNLCKLGIRWKLHDYPWCINNLHGQVMYLLNDHYFNNIIINWYPYCFFQVSIHDLTAHTDLQFGALQDSHVPTFKYRFDKMHLPVIILRRV